MLLNSYKKTVCCNSVMLLKLNARFCCCSRFRSLLVSVYVLLPLQLLCLPLIRIDFG